MERHPFSQIKTERLILRPYTLKDADELYNAMKDGIQHLLPWLPWAENEPRPLAEKQKLITTFIEKFNSNEDFVYAIFDSTNSRLLGGTGLHPRVGPRKIEIGYWIRNGETNKGIATESTYGLTKSAFQLGYEQVIIKMKTDNLASVRIPQKLNFKETLDSEHRKSDERLFTMSANQFTELKQFEPVSF